MTPEEDKVQRYLDQFGSEDEFLAHCRVNGVKGCPVQSTDCLLSVAIFRATGAEVAIYTAYGGGWRAKISRHWLGRHALPGPLTRIAKQFDNRLWPDLIAPARR